MPKKKPGMTPEAQSQSFNDTVKRMIDGGELNPIDADTALDKLVTKAKASKGAQPSND